MLYVYGSLMPLRLLEEVRFWKMQEKEHTEVIRELLPQLEPQFVTLMKEWEGVFARAEMAAVQWIEALIRSPTLINPQVYHSIQSLIHTSTIQSRNWIQQLYFMKEHSAAVQANPTAPVVIMHIIRESEYFLGILQAIAPNMPAGTQPQSMGMPFIPSMGASIQRQSDPPISGSVPTPYTAPPHAAVKSIPDHQQPNDAENRKGNPEKSERIERVDSPDILSATGEGMWSSPISAGQSKDHGSGTEDRKVVPIGGHQLPPLPYAYNALEPYIDAETMRLHHDKHHLSYVQGLNKAELELEKARKSGNFDLVKHWERELAFNGAGHYLHTLFWDTMSPNGGGKPTGPIAEQIQRTFGSFEQFQKQFTAAADKVEGGGWAILVWSPRSRRVEILQAEKHQNLSQWDVIPLLPLDVWEHAYYLKYKNERAKYIEAWWHVVNWPYVNERYITASRLKWAPY